MFNKKSISPGLVKVRALLAFKDLASDGMVRLPDETWEVTADRAQELILAGVAVKLTAESEENNADGTDLHKN